MAHYIEYAVGSVMNTQTLGYFDGHSWGTQTEQPERVNLIWFIRIDSMETEYVSDLDKSEAKRRWNILAPGRKIPHGYTTQTAVAFAEAIWLDTVWRNVAGHASVVNRFFLDALATFQTQDQWDDMRYNGRRIDWTLFAEIGEEAGVDIRIDAWLAGVPLEYILAE